MYDDLYPQKLAVYHHLSMIKDLMPLTFDYPPPLHVILVQELSQFISSFLKLKKRYNLYYFL